MRATAQCDRAVFTSCLGQLSRFRLRPIYRLADHIGFCCRHGSLQSVAGLASESVPSSNDHPDIDSGGACLSLGTATGYLFLYYVADLDCPYSSLDCIRMDSRFHLTLLLRSTRTCQHFRQQSTVWKQSNGS